MGGAYVALQWRRLLHNGSEARFQDAQHRANFPIHFAMLISVIASASNCAAFGTHGTVAHFLSRRLCDLVWRGAYAADGGEAKRPTSIRDALQVTAILEARSRTFRERNFWSCALRGAAYNKFAVVLDGG